MQEFRWESQSEPSAQADTSGEGIVGVGNRLSWVLMAVLITLGCAGLSVALSNEVQSAKAQVYNAVMQNVAPSLISGNDLGAELGLRSIVDTPKLGVSYAGLSDQGGDALVENYAGPYTGFGRLLHGIVDAFSPQLSSPVVYQGQELGRFTYGLTPLAFFRAASFFTLILFFISLAMLLLGVNGMWRFLRHRYEMRSLASGAGRQGKFEASRAFMMLEAAGGHDPRLDDMLLPALDSLGHALVLADEHGNIHYLNRIAQQLTGWSVNKARGKSSRSVISMVDAYGQAIENPLERCLNDDEDKVNATLRMRLHSGEIKLVQAEAVLIRSPVGRVKGALMSFYTLSGPPRQETTGPIEAMDSQAAEEGIEADAAEKWLRDRMGPVMDDPSQQVYLFDTTTLYIVEANRTAINAHGVDFEQLTRMTPMNIAPDLDFGVFDQCVSTLRNGRERTVTFQAQFLKADGHLHPMEVRMMPLKAPDSPFYVMIAQTARGAEDDQATAEAEAVPDEIAVESDEVDKAARPGMRQAIDTGQLQLRYQPVMDTAAPNDTIVAIEGFVWWKHPQQGALDGKAVIGLAEQEGVLDDLQSWTFSTAVDQLCDWLEAGMPPVPLILHVPPLNLRRVNDIIQLEEKIRPLRFIGASIFLVLDISHDSFDLDDPRMERVFSRLSQAGVRIGLDEVGGRELTVPRLERLQVDLLKIGREFMRDLPESPQAQSVARGLLERLQGFRGDLIVERVERQSQVDFIKGEGCYLMQGNFFSGPVTGSDMGKLLTQAKIRALGKEDKAEP